MAAENKGKAPQPSNPAFKKEFDEGANQAKAMIKALEDMLAERLAHFSDGLKALEKDAAAADRTLGEKIAHLEKENALLKEAVNLLENEKGEDWQPEGFSLVTIVTSVDAVGRTIGKANAVFDDAAAAAEAVRNGSIFIETGCFAVFKQAWKLLPKAE